MMAMRSSIPPVKLAGTLVVGLEGPWPAAREAAWISQWRPAGIILFSRNVTCLAQLEDLCAFLHDALPGGEIVADHEGGPVSQLAVALGRPPVAWALGVMDDPGLTRAVHEETGRRLRAAGIDRVLAPCADVLTELRNPVIGARAFGSDPALVARHVVASVEGLMSGGVLTCLKHWPGHGASGQDSHLREADAPVISGAGPFLAGLAAGADAVMVGHLQAGPGGDPGTLDSVRMNEWRAGLSEAASSPVQLYADDVTMGGLRAAMSRRGIRPVDGLPEGMVDPASLPLAWLEELVASGSDRLLVRGIPWAGLPLAEDSEMVSFSGCWEPRKAAPVDWPAGAYHEALQRQRDCLDPKFRSADRVLGWLDLTVGDRWEVAGGELPGQREDFAGELSAFFAGVQDLAVEGSGNQAPLDRILVTSHRPLPRTMSRSEYWADRVAPAGRCVAMGHPSLAEELALVLGPSWSVTRCYDVDWKIFEKSL